MILRINIGAYVLTQPVRDAVTALASDRLFLRSNVTINDGGMRGAVEQLSDRSTPELLIVESSALGDDLFTELNTLADICQPGTRVIVVGAENDINLFKTLIDQGISQYFLSTVTVDELKTAINNAFADQYANSKCRTIAFSGFRGGVGSSMLAHNVGAALTELYDEDVIIIDLDISFGTLALGFNIQPQKTIADALSQGTNMDEALLMRYFEQGGKNLSLLCAPGNLTSGVEITDKSVERLLDVVKQMASYVIIDVPHVWSSWVQDILINADETVLVGTPDLYNLRDGKNLVEFLAPNRGVDGATRLVLNKVGEIKNGSITEKDFKEVLNLSPAVSIPYDTDTFATALNNGQMIKQVADRSKAAIAIEDLAKIVSGKDSLTNVTKKGGMFSNLFKK